MNFSNIDLLTAAGRLSKYYFLIYRLTKSDNWGTGFFDFTSGQTIFIPDYLYCI